MSSTNRSDARDKHIADYYVTPQKAIHNFLDVFLKDEWIDLSTQEHMILDPCAWWKNWAEDMSYPAVLFEYGADYNKIITNDIREDSPAKYHLDFLNKNNWNTYLYDMVITNPPFNIAQDIIDRALEVCKQWGYVIMLLRLNYFWGKVRQEFWKKHLPIRAYVHNRRMSFTPDWKTDSVEYMHCVWKKGENPIETKLNLIYDF